MTQVDDAPSPEQLEEAAATARQLLEESIVLRTMYRVRAIGLRLIKLADSVVEHDLEYGWEIQDSLVSTTLRINAFESANQHLDTASTLERDVVDVVLPALSALALEEESCWEDGN